MRIAFVLDNRGPTQEPNNRGSKTANLFTKCNGKYGITKHRLSISMPRDNYSEGLTFKPMSKTGYY